MANNGYRMELRRHVEDLQGRFGEYTPTQFDMGLFNDHTLSDRALYFMTKLWRDATDRNYRGLHNQQNDADNRRMYLVMSRGGDGSYKITDRYNHGNVVAIIKPGADKLEFIGTKRDITMLGGRGEFSQIVKMAEDLDVLKDHPYKRVD